MKLIEYEQPTSAPVPKVQAAGIAGVIVTAVVTVLTLSGIAVPDGVSEAAFNAISGVVILFSAIQTVLTFGAAYFKKDAKPAPVVDESKRTGAKQ
jgi:hypothetical protein